ncbi:MAG: putative glycosyltransferase, group 1 [Ilumatobacteraceae bacterium]|nr:putative glycosyltransferase, group 1 [Ilumatobacteraceae bacterium]
MLWSARYKPSIGGEERYTERLAKGLARLGCTVEVVTNTLDDVAPIETVDDVPVTRLPFPAARLGDMVALRSVRDGLRLVTERLRPDLVDLQTCGPSIAHYRMHRRALAVPLVTTFHGVYPPDAGIRASLVEQFESSAACIAASATTKASLSAIVGEIGDDVAVRLPPLDDERGTPVPPAADTAVVLGVGRLVPEKGWETLLDAMQRVLHILPTARLVLVGDGPDRARLEASVAQRGLGSVVRFTGTVDDDHLTALFDSCNVVCIPSHIAEGFGMVAVEASVRARPVVASRAGGLIEAVVDGVTGLLVPSADPQALAEALVRVLADPMLAAELGRRGREFSRGFSTDALAADTLDTFRRALLAGGSR